MRQDVIKARTFQAQRSADQHKPNSTLTGRELDHVAILDDQSRQLLNQAMTELGLSARAYDKIRRVSRTIADLEQSSTIQVHHLAEAIGYRLLDRQQ
jgi:magnesium chelatase family protein